MKRDGRVEILRCGFMFGICLLHAITQGGQLYRWIDNLVTPSVVGFVVLSAWYGVSFKPSKILRLAGVAAWCAACVAIYFQKNIALGCFQTYWFLWAYVLMMFFAPLIDSAKLGLRTVFPAFLAVFVWGGVSNMPVFRDILPHTAGLTAYSGVTFIGIYAVVRAFKRSRLAERLTTRQLAIAAIVSAVFCECGFYKYNSPFALILALSLLLLVLRLPEMPRIGRIATWLSPSLFAVYLYHTGAGFNVLKAIERYFGVDLGMSVYLNHVLTALVVFWGCILIDLPRRALCRLFARPIQGAATWLDQRWEMIVEKGDRFDA